MIRSFRPLVAALLLLTVNCSLLTDLKAQTPKTYTSSEILLGLKKLNVLGSVMYLAAHPDDENTRLIAYLANERLLDTSYLSCTRGDGGQNLIGPELREGLGVIRTQELLAARRLDGGRQFFTRANDFGFSKTADETFRIWDKEQVLADMVWVIRQRRPDVLLTRFPPDARAGHGHHQASALLAAEAFDAAGDPKRFPEQLQYVQAWQPKRLLWNTGSASTISLASDVRDTVKLKLDVGGYNPLLGLSYGEIAARSRSQHKSQGMGTAAQRGDKWEYFLPVKGERATQDLFDGVDQTWNRVPGGAAVGKLIEEVIRTYDASNPNTSVAGLLKVREEMLKLHQSGSYYGNPIINLKLQEIEILIQNSLGLSFEAIATEVTTTLTDSIAVNVNLLNRSNHEVGVKIIYSTWDVQVLNPKLDDIPGATKLVGGQPFNYKLKMRADIEGLMGDRNWWNTQPYWLVEPPTKGMYTIELRKFKYQSAIVKGREKGINIIEIPAFRAQLRSPLATDYSGPQHSVYHGTYSPDKDKQRFLQFLIGRPENVPVFFVGVQCMIDGEEINFITPVQYKHTDPVLGELYQPVAVVPAVMVNLPPARSYVFANLQAQVSGGTGQIVPVTLRAGRAGVSGNLSLQVPAGWRVVPATVPFSLKNKDEEQTVSFKLYPETVTEGKAELRAVATVDGQAYTRGIQQIEYPHIPTQFLFPEAVAPLVKLDLKRRGQNVAYLMGAGDEVPDALRQIGYTVTLLEAKDLTAVNLKKYDALVVGIRAYNTVDRLKTQQPEILKYIEAGGNVVVQYVVNRGTVMPEIGPYPMTLSTDRVTVEDAPVTLSKHQLLAAPNKITAEDFKGWVQEQGLYYPSKWDPKYQTVISSSDPGEAAKESAILVTDYGKGHYIYTGLSLFRELPAGVPGAYRIITNMISYGK